MPGDPANPAGDLAATVRRAGERPISKAVRAVTPRARVSVDGPGLFDVAATWKSFRQDLFAFAPAALAQANDGDPALLLRLVELGRRANPAVRARSELGPAHRDAVRGPATPWGGPASDPAARAAAASATLDPLPVASFAPFDRFTSAHNGVAETCERWPATTVAPPPEPGLLPAVPTLILNGAWDMSTPVPGAREEAARSTTAQLVVVPHAGHSLVTGTRCTARVVRRFFRNRPLARPCARNPRPEALAVPRRVAT